MERGSRNHPQTTGPPYISHHVGTSVKARFKREAAADKEGRREHFDLLELYPQISSHWANHFSPRHGECVFCHRGHGQIRHDPQGWPGSPAGSGSELNAPLGSASDPSQDTFLQSVIPPFPLSPLAAVPPAWSCNGHGASCSFHFSKLVFTAAGH